MKFKIGDRVKINMPAVVERCDSKSAIPRWAFDNRIFTVIDFSRNSNGIIVHLNEPIKHNNSRDTALEDFLKFMNL